jgi:hypothetical protein
LKSALRDWWAPAVLTTLVLVAYAGAPPHAFLFDDQFAVAANPVVNGHLPLRAIWTRDFWGQGPAHTVGSYRPVVDLTLALDWRLGHGAPGVFRASSVLWHLLTVLAVFSVWRTIVGAQTAAVAAALLAVAAAPSEAVLCSVGRADILAALFSLLGLRAFRRPGWLAALELVACFGLALGSKESAIMAPVAWVAVDVLLPANTLRWTTRAGRLALCTFPLALYLWGRRFALGALYAPWTNSPLHNPLLASGEVGRVFGAARVFLTHYLAGIFDPWRRIYDCSAKACGPATPSDGLAWTGLVLAIAVGLSPMLLRRRSPSAAAGLAWCVLFFLPVSNFVVLGPTIYGERLLYAPAIGLSISVAAVLWAIDSVWGRGVMVGSLVAIVGMNAAAVRTRQGDWSDGGRLLQSGLRYSPDSAVVQVDVAVEAMRARDYPRAEQAARRAVELFPGYMMAHRELAGSLFAQGRLAEAAPEFERAYALGRDATLINDYANFLARRGELGQARDTVDGYLRTHDSTAELDALRTKLLRAIARTRPTVPIPAGP